MQSLFYMYLETLSWPTISSIVDATSEIVCVSTAHLIDLFRLIVIELYFLSQDLNKMKEYKNYILL